MKRKIFFGLTWKAIRNRRGFVAMVSVAVMSIVMIAAVTTYGAALKDLKFASRSVMRTKALLNARSGIEVALSRLPLESESFKADNNSAVEVERGGYKVEVTSEPASAFGPLLANLGQDTPVYFVESIGEMPIREGRNQYSVRLQAVVQMVDAKPKIVLWSEGSAEMQN